MTATPPFPRFPPQATSPVSECRGGRRERGTASSDRRPPIAYRPALGPENERLGGPSPKFMHEAARVLDQRNADYEPDQQPHRAAPR